MAKVGAVASVKKTTKTANTPVQAAPVQQPVPQAAPTGMAMTPQNVTAYTAPTQYVPTPEENYTSKMSNNALRRFAEDKAWDKRYNDYYIPERQLTKNRAEEDRSMSGSYLKKQQIDDFLRMHPEVPGRAIDWQRQFYAGKRAMAQPTVDQNFFDLWLLANGIKF